MYQKFQKLTDATNTQNCKKLSLSLSPYMYMRESIFKLTTLLFHTFL